MRKKINRIKIKQNAKDIGICFEPLEPRLLLSGSWATGVGGPSPNSPSGSTGSFVPEAVILSASSEAFGSDALLRNQHALGTGTFVDVLANAPVLDAFDTASAADAVEPVIEATPTSNQTTAETGETATNLTEANPEPQNEMKDAVDKRELVFVNENVADYQQLIADLQGKDGNRIIEVVVLEADRDGIEQISGVLADRSDLTAVHFITHGADGLINLGSGWLTSATLQQNRDAVAGWGDALTESGDILFYGCNIAVSNVGQGLLGEIAGLTGADVAASDDLTGSAENCGDWELEYTAGKVETTLAISARTQQEFSGVLAITTNSTSSAMTTGATSLTWSHTVNAGSNTALFVGVSMENSGGQVNSLTYGGTPMTLVGRAAGTHTVEIWQLVAPTVGTANIVANFNSSRQVVAGAAAFDGVNQVTPIGTAVFSSGISATPTINVASAAGELVIDTLFANDGPTASLGAGQSAQWNLSTGSGSGTVRGAGSTEAGAASVTMSWNLSASIEWEIGAVSIKAAGNNAPTATNLSAPETYTEDTPRNLTDIVISDVDSASVTATLTLSNVAAGSLNTGTSGAVTSTYNAGSGVWTASGAIADVNSLLAGLTFTPALNFNSNFSIATSVSDGVAAPITGSKAMTGTAVNDTPVADDDFYSINEDASLVEPADGVLLNDADVDGNSITAVLVSGPLHAASFTLNADGSFSYTPVANWSGTDSFTYKANDGTTDGNEATATITVDPVNDAPTFGTGVGDGIVTTAVGASAEVGRSVTAQPDGKILLAGYSWNGSNYDFALTRYNVDGTLDTSFSTDGKVTTSIGVGSAYGQSVAVQTDGKILVGGYAAGATGDEYALARYNSDGSLDTSFSGDGIVTTSFGLGDAYGESLTLQADGKILVSGYFFNGAANLLSLARYNADGSLDTSFSGDGLLTTSFGGVDNYGWDVAVQSDGAIVVVGSSSAGGTPDFAVARYDSSGNLDITFSGDGLLTTPIGAGIDQAYSVAIQDDGKLLVAGYSFNGTDNDFAIVRYNSNGTLDTSFGGGDGIVTTAVGAGNDAGYSVTVQADGKILVAGLSLIGGNNDFALVRYNSNGTLDTSFGGGDGIATTAVGAGNDGGYGVMVQADGKIVVAGTSNNGSNDDFAVVRYNSDGTLDTGFDSILANTLNGTPTFIENGVAVVLDADVQIFDAELSALDNFTGTTLILARNGGANAQDVFSATGTLSALTQGGNLVVGGTAIGMVTTNSGGTLVLTFNASATNTRVNSAMQQIAYSNSSDAPPASTQIDWTFDDGNTGAQGTGGALTATGSTTVTITAVNDAPTVTTTGSALAYTENDPAKVIDPALTVSDPDNVNLTSAIVRITGNFTTGQDVLAFADQLGITGNWDSATGILTLTGTTTVANYQTALRTVTYQNTSDTPDTATRTISFFADDGIDSGAAATRNINITAVNDTPVITSNGGGVNASINVAENTTTVTTVTSNDVDGGSPIYSILAGGDASKFSINNTTGALSFVTAPDFENPTDAGLNNVYDLTVQVSDGNGGTDTQAISVTVTNVSNTLIVSTTTNVNDGDTSSAEALNASKGVDGSISLFEAITAANNSVETVTISFNITDPLVDGAHTIMIGPGGLPQITNTVIIDGTTDPDFTGTPIIVLDGSGAGAVDGLVLAAGSDGSTIRGLVINRFGDTGIKLIDSDNHTLVGNYIGTDITGTVDQGNATKGIQIENSAGNLIGGFTAADRNVIAGNNDDGIIIWGSGSTLNVIQGNYIGVDSTGNNGLGNGADGICISGGANNNTIGGDRTAGEGNVISGQIGASSDGIEIDNVGADNNKIYGNYIGTNHDGTAAIANARHGVVIYDEVQGTEVGGTGTGQGNIISGNNDSGIVIDGNGSAATTGNVIVANYIGLNAAGTASITNAYAGIEIFGGAGGNTIGGTTAAARNVIAGNDAAGIRLGGSGSNVIQGNYIGTDTSGTVNLGNTDQGIYIDSTSTGNTIGGTAPGAGNLISGNNAVNAITSAGIYVLSSGNTIQGNYIGTDITGTADLFNNGAGITLSAASANNLIGGTVAGAGNIIGFNHGDGVRLTGSNPAPAGSGNAIVGNQIFSNQGNGIDLKNDDVTANDTGDADTGPNDLQNYPVLTSANSNSAGTTIVGTLDTNRFNQDYRIEFFASRPSVADTANGEGERYLGFVTVTTNGSGDASFNTTLANVWVNSGDKITATATVDLGGSYGDTSEFAVNVTATSTGIVVVDTTSDVSDGTTTSITNLGNARGADGRISLREAIIAANNTAGADKIVFAIPHTDTRHYYYANNGVAGSVSPGNITATSASSDADLVGADPDFTKSWWSIQVSAAGLPAITTQMTIDASTQTGYTGTPIIELNGSAVSNGDPNGFTIETSGTTIRGFVINRFGDDAIEIDNQGGGNTIVGNYLGTDVSGLLTTFGNQYGITVKSDGNTIGGASAADRNVIAGNSTSGLSFGIGFWQDADNNVVQGNYIGVGANGTTAMGNRQGITFQNTADFNLIGGETPGAGNVIAFNSQNGVDVIAGTNNAIVRNSIHSNGLLGINLGAAGVTVNDNGDGDSGANNLQNYPVLTSAVTTGTQITITGSLNSTASTSFRIEFYANATGDDTGYGEGQTLIGITDVTTDGSGYASFLPTFSETVSAGSAISAIVSRLDGGDMEVETSEFAQYVTATSATNTSPVLDNTKSPALTSINEDSGAPSGAVGTLVSALVDFTNPAGQVDNVTDADSGALLGIVVTAADTTYGTWWYSTNGGTNWDALGAVSDANARLLSADVNTRLYFEPNANYNGTIANAITFRAWDQTTGTNGGVADTSSTSGTYLDSFSVQSYGNNDGSLNWTNDWIENDSGGGGDSGGLIRIDAATGILGINAGTFGNWISREADLSGATSATLSFSLDNRLSNAASQIVVQASDDGGGSFTSLAGGTITKDTANGVLNFDISAYIAANTQIRFYVQGVASEHIEIDDVQISVTQIGNGGTTAFSTATDTASLVVNAINDAPVITSNGGGATAAINVTENTTAVTTVTSTDIDGGTPVYSISGGADALKFAINSSTGVLTFAAAPDYETPTDIGADNVYEVQVTVSDGAGGSDVQSLSVTVIDDNDNEPVITSGQSFSVSEAAANGTSLGFVAATDPDTVGTLQNWTILSGNDDGIFTINSSTGELTVADNTNLNFETTSSYTLFLAVYDGPNMSGGESVDINVTDVNEAPIVDLNGTNGAGNNFATTFTEDGGAVNVADVDAIIIDVDDTSFQYLGINLFNMPDGTSEQIVVAGYTFSYGSGDVVTRTVGSTDFEIDFDATGFSIVKEFGGNIPLADLQMLLRGITYENTSQNPTSGDRVIEFTAGDASGLVGPVATSTITVNPVNDNPTGLPLITGTATEDQALSVDTSGISDVDGLGTFTYQWQRDGADISGATGTSYTLGDADVAANITVEVSYTDGGGTIETLTSAAVGPIVNVNDAPVILVADTPILYLAGTMPIDPALTVTDIDDTMLESAQVWFGDGFQRGHDRLRFVDQLGITGSFSNNTGILTLTGTASVADYETALRSVQYEDANPTPAQGILYVNFSVFDGTDTSNIETRVIEIVDNLPPRVGDDAFTVAEGSVNVLDVAANDTDAENSLDLTSIVITSVPTNGNVVVNGDGTVTYTHDGSEITSDSFGYTIKDTDANVSSEGFVFVTVTAVNDSPLLAANTGVTVAEGSTGTVITNIMLNEGDPDDDGADMVYTLTGDVGNGMLRLNGTVLNTNDTFTQADIDAGLLTYDHGGSESTSDSFDFSLADGGEDGSTPATGTFSINVTPVNNAPVLTAIGAQTVDELATLTFTATATDPDLPADTLTFSLDAASVALGMSIDASTGAFSWTPTEAQGGTAPSVTVTVTDNGTGNLVDSETFTITVNEVNNAPVLTAIGAQTVDELATLTFTATATDPDLPADTLTFSLDAASVALGMSIDASTGAFSWTPTEAQGGTAPSVTVTVTDNGTGNLVDSETFTITVNEVNNAPVLTAIGAQTVDELATLTFTATATDPDLPADTLTFSLDAASVALGMSIDASTGAFSWTPTEAQGGTAPSVTVTVTDNGTGNLVDSETFTITVNEVNNAPVLTAIGAQTVDELATLTFTATATDPDLPADTLTFSLDAASVALGMSIDASTGAFSWTPTEAQGGTAPSVTVTVTDNGTGNLVDSETFTITVNEVNNAPVLTAIGAQTVDELATLTFTATATDPDLPADTLTFSLDAASVALGMSIDASTGAFSWTPTEAQGGTAPSVTVTVTDNGTGNLVDSETFTITVNEVNNAPVLTAIGAQTVDELATLTFTATATDPDLPADTLTFSLDAASVALGMSIDASTGAFSWTPTEAQGGTAPSVTVTVTDNGTGNLVDSETFTITVNEVNNAPVLTAIGAQTVDELATLTFTATATDPDLPADTLTFSLDAASVALGMSIDASTGAFSWTPTEAQGGTAPSVTVTVTDNGTGNLVDSETFTITVNEVNNAPVLTAIGAQTVDELATLTFTATATDPDLPADTLTFSLDAASVALGMSIDASTGAFSWTPTEAQGGTAPSVTVTVTDNGTGNLVDSETFTITVNEVNNAPVLTAIGAQTVDELATLTFTATATDPDLPADTLTFSLDAASVALGMSIDASTGAFSWTPTEAQGGTAPSVTVTVTDNGTGNLVDSETFTITVNEVNNAPVLTAIGAQTVDELATLTFTATATDPDLPADTLTFSLDAASVALGMSIDASTGAFSWTPTEAQGGTAPSVTVTVTDNGTGNLVDSETFTITVNEVNNAPVLTAIGAQTVDELATLTFTATATDPDLPADTLTFSLDAASVALGMSIDASTGAFSWTPTEAQGGTAPSVTVTVTDNGTGNLVDSETFTITVNEVNNAPVLTAIGAQTVDELATLTFTATATDPDLPADTLTFSLDAASVALGMSIDASTGAFSWTPTEAQGGTAPSVTVTVTDNGTGNLVDSETFTITVNEVNNAPVLTAIGAQTVDELATLTFTATATDPDLPADTLTFSLDAASVALGMSIDASTGAFSWTPTEAQGGTAPSVTVTVTDNGTGNLVDSETFTITVNEVNNAPVLTAIGAQTVDELATLTFTATATDPDLPADTLTFSLDAASVALGMSIDASTGAFSWTPTEAQGGTAPSVTVTVTDNGTGNLVDSETFTITVNEVNNAPVLTAIGAQTVDELATLTFTATATDPDLPADTLTFSLDAASVALGMSIDASTGAFSWTPTEAQGGTAPSVTVTVTDNGTGNLVDSETFTITVNEVNNAPVLTAIGAQTVDELATLTFTATATDPDLPADTLTFSLDAASVALGMSIDASTGAFSWTPTEAQGGTAPSVTVTVTDNGTGNLVDSETFTITVNEVNNAPVLTAIGAQTVDELATLTFTATATDPDLPADTLTFSLDAASVALGMSIDASTGAFSWTPTEAQGGTAPSVTVTVTDNGTGNLVDSETFTITVNEVNNAPVLTAIGAQTVDELATLTFTATATDPDLPADTLTFSLDAASVALGMSIDASTGAFSWTPTEAQGGTAPSVTVTVTDNGTGNLVDSETFTITVNEVNNAPVLTAIGAQTVDELATLTFTATATDPDLPADTLTFSLDAASVALGMSIDASTGAFSWTPTEAQGGTAPSVTVTVTDNGTGNLVDSETFTITVNEVNNAPVLTAIGAQTVDELATLTFTATATDPDLPADTLTFSLDAASVALGMSIDASTGAFSWTPTEAQGGTAPSVTVTVTDNGTGNLVDSETFTITVNEVNNAPVLTAIGAQTVDELATLTFTATATDPDLPADTLTFSLDAASVALGMSIDASTGAFSWTPTEAQGGTAPSVTVTVTDNGTGNLVDSETFTITVNEVNNAPVLTAIGAQTVDELATLTFTATATDPDLPADTLTFSLDAASVALGMSIDASTGAFSWTPTEAQGGTAPSVTVTVTDNGTGNLVDSETFTITVNEVNNAPVLTAIGAQTVDELATLTFTATATDPDLPADTLTFSLDAASVALGMSIDASTGAFSWTPTEAQGGTAPSVTVTVTDNGTGNLVDSETFTITVNEVNNAPVLTAIGAQTVDELATLTFTATATDPDLPADTLTFSLDAASVALGMSIDASTGAFSWTPTEAQGGTAPSVTVTVTDNGTGNLVDSETFTITVNEVNNAPVLTAIGAQTVDELATLTFTATATDPDLPADTLTFSLDAASVALGMSIDASTGAFSWTPTEAQGGTAPSVTVTVTDNGTGNLVDSETFTITVNEVNNAPLASDATINATEDTAYNGTLPVASDADGDMVTYSLDADAVKGTAVVNADGSFSYSAALNTNGADSFTYMVSDGNGGVNIYTVTVNVAAVNDAPVGLVTIDNMTPAEGDTLSASNTLADADGLSGPISYQWYLDGVALGGATGATYTTVPADVGGVITVVASYTDDQGTFESVTSAATAAVTNVNNAPVIGGIGAGAVTEDVDPDADGLLEVGGVLSITDPDVGESSFQAGTVAGTYGSLTIDASGNWNYTADNSQAAIQQLDAGESVIDVLTVTTADGTTHTITITINGAEDAPVIDEPPGPIDEGDGDPDPDDEVDPIETEPDEEPPIEESLPVTEETGQQAFYPSDGHGIVNSQSTLPRRLVAAISRMASVMVFRNADASQSVNVGPLNFMTRDPASPKEAHFAPVATVFFSPEVMAQALDHLQKQIDDTMELDANQGQLIIGAAAGLGATVMVGYVVWAFRGASLLLGALSAMPMWRCFDPLPVLIGNDKKRDEDAEEKNGEPELEDDEKRVRDLLDSEQAVKAHQAHNGRGN